MAEDSANVNAGGGERYYEESGEHGRAGYYVKTVGNAPVVAPTALTAEEAAAKAAPKRTGSASAWCDSCPSVHSVCGGFLETRSLCSVSLLLCAALRNTGGTWENKDMSKWAKVQSARVYSELQRRTSTTRLIVCSCVACADRSSTAARGTELGRNQRPFSKCHRRCQLCYGP